MRHLLLTALLLVVSATLSAQQHPQPGNQHPQQREDFSPERFDRHMEQFIAEHAALTQEEANAFFPLLHEMLAKQRENNDKQRELMGQCAGGQPTQAQYEQAIMASIDMEEENKRVERTYYQRFAKCLSWEKIYKVKAALVDFQMEALRRFAPPQQQQQQLRRHDFSHWDWGGAPEKDGTTR